MRTEATQSAEIFHPGVFLEMKLETLGWNQADLADVLGRPPRLVSEIISGKRSITPETAIGLSKALGISAQTWMNLEAQFQLAQTQHKENNIELKAKLYGKFPVREMIRRGWIQTTRDIELLKSRLLQFFEMESLDDEETVEYAARQSNTYKEKLPVQRAWYHRAKVLARAMPVKNKFSQARLKACKQALRNLIHESSEIRHVPKVLSEAGIRFVIVEPLPGSKIDGATFWLGDEPVIVMSLRFNRIDNFWFTLMHEITHVENGDAKGTLKVIIDVDLLGDDVATKPRCEQLADSGAAEFCIPEAELNNFIIRASGYYLDKKILGFALVHQVHPGIVVGQLQHRGAISYTHHRKFLEKVRDIIAEPAMTDGYGYKPSV